MNSRPGSSSPDISLGQVLGDAIRYWEPRRIVYNVVLAVSVLAWLALTWPHFRPVLHLQTLLLIVILATLANLCYCAAYFADVPIQLSPLRAIWQRRRWALWLLGMLLGLIIANYWIADEIYPFVR